MTLHLRRWRATAAAATLLCATSLGVVVLPAPAVAAPGDVATGDDWVVSRAPGGFEVTLELPSPLPVRSDAPTLVVDGETVGIATESADGRALTVVTSDPDVVRARSVEAGWASEAVAPGAAPQVSSVVEVPEEVTAEALDADPGARGRFGWTESIYKFGDQAVPLSGIGGVRGELEGKLYLPTTGGARPVVLLLHGRHSSCYGPGSANPDRWPCATAPGLPAGQTRYSIPSYAGYDGTARALASQGYAVVSVSANAVNSNDNQLAPDQGAQARGQLLLDTLTMLDRASKGESVSYRDAWEGRDVTLAQALSDGAASYELRREGFVLDGPDLDLDPVTAADLVGRFDLGNIGMMGHSRGGEGVTSAATLNQGLAQPWAIRSILPLAPVDFGRMTVPDVPMNVVLPYCDGDVSNQQGQHMLDDSRYAFADDVLRSGTWVMGANHNFYNTAWTPGLYKYAVTDDWSGTNPASVRATEATCGTAPSTAGTSIRMTAQEQYDQGTAYMAGWFRLTMGDEQQFLPMFDGTGQVPASLGDEDIRTQATAPSSARATIASFEQPSSLARTFGGATLTPCASLSGRTVTQQVAPCATTLASAQAPHWTPASNGGNVPATPLTRMAWTTGNGEVRVAVPRTMRDASAYDRVTVKVAADESVATGTDLTMTVVDGSGATWSAPVSQLNPAALVRMPTSSSAAATSTLKKVVLQQVTVPVADLAAAGVTTTDVREVRFTGATGADGTAAGAAYLSDLALERSAVGTAVSRTQPVIGVYAPGVEEGNGPGTVDLAVHLDKPATRPVTGFVSLLGSTTSRAGATMERVTFAPGETCRVVTAAVQGDTAPSTSVATTVKASVINTSGAVMGKEAILNTRVREDDGLLPSGNPATTPTPLPPFGTPGEVCDELASFRAGGEVTTPGSATAGASVTVSTTGFRPGEGVTFAAPDVPGVEPVVVVADTTGAAATTLPLPADVARGVVPVTATGVATGRVATGSLTVRDESTTTLTIAPEAPALREAVTLTATVAGGDTTGTVEFLDGETVLGSAPTQAGVATLEVPGFGVGPHSLTARFVASDVTGGSVSAPVTFTLDARTTTVVLSLDAASAALGQQVQASVAVDGATEGSVTVGYAGRSTTVAVGADGRATVPLPALPAGSYQVTARYLGSADAGASTTVSVPLTVARAATRTRVTAPARAVRGRDVRVTVRVDGGVAGHPVTGRVRLTANGGRTFVREVTNGSATFTVRFRRIDRPLRLQATYVGSGNHTPSTSARAVVRAR